MFQWFLWQWNIFHANVKEKISKGIYIVTWHPHVTEVSVKRLKVCLCISNYEDTNTHQCMYHMIYKPYINNGGLSTWDVLCKWTLSIHIWDIVVECALRERKEQKKVR